MRTFFLIVVLVLTFSNNSYGQFSIYEEQYNSLKEIQKIPDNMTYEEFLKIQRNVGWSKILISAVVPGYLHFYADRPIKGSIIAVTRVIGYGFIAYAAIEQYKLLNSTSYNSQFDANEKVDRMNTNATYFTIGGLLNFIAFFFDWADATMIIESERNQIYFKYGLDKERRNKLGLSYNQLNNSINFNYEISINNK